MHPAGTALLARPGCPTLTDCGSVPREPIRRPFGITNNGFIEKEKLGPAGPAHQLPATSLVVEDTNEPRLSRPAPAKQRFGCGVVDDPAVADVKASLRDSDDIAKRGHPVLQRSPISSNSSRECHCARPRVPLELFFCRRAD